MLSQMLTSRPRPARYRAHLQSPHAPQNESQARPDAGCGGRLVQRKNTPDQTFSLADQSDLECVHLDLESCWLSEPEQVSASLHDLVSQDGEDVFDDVIGSPLSFPQGLPSPLFADSLVPEHTPFDSQGQRPNIQALCRLPDDQAPPVLGNLCCIPALFPLPLLL